MVKLSDMSDLAQKSWAISCAAENDWMCQQQCNAHQGFFNAMKVQEPRYDLFGRMRFDELVDEKSLLCHVGVSDRRGQGPVGKFAPVPYNTTKPCTK